MIIELERSGGFTGIGKKCVVDTDVLPKDISYRIKTFFSRSMISKATNEKKINVPDSFNYRFSVVGSGKKQEFVINELDIDNELKLALDFVFKHYQ